MTFFQSHRKKLTKHLHLLDIKEVVTARSLVVLKSTVSAIRYVTLFSFNQSLIHIILSVSCVCFIFREVLDVLLAADAKAARTHLVGKMVSL